MDQFEDLDVEGLKQGKPEPNETVEKVETCSHLTLCGQGSNEYPEDHTCHPDNLVFLSVQSVEVSHVCVGIINDVLHVLKTENLLSGQAGLVTGLTNWSLANKLNRYLP